MWNREYEKLFPPGIIRTGRITRATVITVVKKDADGKNPSPAVKPLLEYTEVVFLFDRDGFVERRIEYYGGKVSSAYDYGRDSIHRIVKETFSYVDSAWKSIAGFVKTVKDYTYDEKGNLVKIKQEGANGEILPDDRTMAETYQYDEQNRQTYWRNFTYYEGKEPGSHEVKTLFSGKAPRSTAVSFENGKQRTLVRTSYNNSGLPLTATTLDYWSEEKQLEETWQYDAMGRILKYTSSSIHTYSECPEKETFNEDYFYNVSGLLSKIRHSFVLGSCEMRVVYN
jgi:hypothetical protein